MHCRTSAATPTTLKQNVGKETVITYLVLLIRTTPRQRSPSILRYHPLSRHQLANSYAGQGPKEHLQASERLPTSLQNRTVVSVEHNMRKQRKDHLPEESNFTPDSPEFLPDSSAGRASGVLEDRFGSEMCCAFRRSRLPGLPKPFSLPE